MSDSLGCLSYFTSPTSPECVVRHARLWHRCRDCLGFSHHSGFSYHVLLSGAVAYLLQQMTYGGEGGILFRDILFRRHRYKISEIRKVSRNIDGYSFWGDNVILFKIHGYRPDCEMPFRKLEFQRAEIDLPGCCYSLRHSYVKAAAKSFSAPAFVSGSIRTLILYLRSVYKKLHADHETGCWQRI